LLPAPHTTTTRAPPRERKPNSAAIKSAAPRPAFSINSKLGTWQAALACASKPRISSRDKTGIIGAA
jgi:hypothetical protein